MANSQRELQGPVCITGRLSGLTFPRAGKTPVDGMPGDRRTREASTGPAQALTPETAVLEAAEA